ncbi:MAG: hypothetical protein ACKOZM_07230 [Flavobacteriales bacterium]
MKLLLLLFTSITLSSFAQQIQDFKVKNDNNAQERTIMLDVMRAQLYQREGIEMKFVVNHFKSSGEYAWFEGVAQRKDGKPLVLSTDMRDCCQVFALFRKMNGRWTVAELGAFCTDVCQWGVANRFPNAPKSIFPDDEVYFIE